MLLVTGTLEVIDRARAGGLHAVISARSGETKTIPSLISR
jgi:enolase